VKPGTVSRMRSISEMTESSERLWITRPSCSVIEQNEQPPKQPRWIVTENRIISYAGSRMPSMLGCGRRVYGSS
jgi:hypothetical protein